MLVCADPSLSRAQGISMEFARRLNERNIIDLITTRRESSATAALMH
jgi:hypothetical protein